MQYRVQFSESEFIHVYTDAEHVGSLTTTIEHGRKGGRYDAACNVLESALLAAACAGVTGNQFEEIGTTVMDAIANNYGD